MKPFATLLLGAALALPLAGPVRAADTAPAAKKQQYLYLLRVAPHLQDEKKWTPADQAAAGRHFKRLQEALAAGKLILAGKTSESLDRTFGLVVFEADSEAEARAFMEGDPAVQAGVMTATLHPYAVALLRKAN